MTTHKPCQTRNARAANRLYKRRDRTGRTARLYLSRNNGCLEFGEQQRAERVLFSLLPLLPVPPSRNNGCLEFGQQQLAARVLLFSLLPLLPFPPPRGFVDLGTALRPGPVDSDEARRSLPLNRRISPSPRIAPRCSSPSRWISSSCGGVLALLFGRLRLAPLLRARSLEVRTHPLSPYLSRIHLCFTVVLLFLAIALCMFGVALPPCLGPSRRPRCGSY